MIGVGFISAARIDALRPRLVDPYIEWSAPAPKKLTLDEQCEAAMARLKAHINASCAQHSVAIRSDYVFQGRKRRQRHIDETCEDLYRRFGLLCSPYTLALKDGYISGFGLATAQMDMGSIKFTRIDPRSVWK